MKTRPAIEDRIVDGNQMATRKNRRDHVFGLTLDDRIERVRAALDVAGDDWIDATEILALTFEDVMRPELEAPGRVMLQNMLGKIVRGQTRCSEIPSLMWGWRSGERVYRAGSGAAAEHVEPEPAVEPAVEPERRSALGPPIPKSRRVWEQFAELSDHLGPVIVLRDLRNGELMLVRPVNAEVTGG